MVRLSVMKIQVIKTIRLLWFPNSQDFQSSTTFGNGILEQLGFGNMLNPINCLINARGDICVVPITTHISKHVVLFRAHIL